MLRPDTGNFNRFLASVGLALMAASLIIPYFYFRDTGTLQIPRAELRSLTSTARGALEQRQNRVAQFETPILIFAGLLLIGGGASVCIGGRRLLVAQRKDDAAVDLDRQVRREEYEVRHQSSEEIASSRDRQAKEAVVEESLAGDEATGRAPAADVPDSPEVDLDKPVEAEHHRGTLAQTRAEIARVEETTQQVLGEAEFRRFRFLSEVRIVSDAGGGRQVTLDGLFEAQVPNQLDIALELRAVNLPVGLLTGRFETFSDQLLAQVARYKQVTGKEALGWLLIVLSRVAEPASSSARRAVQRDFNDRLGGLGRCTILSETELNDAPNRFRQLFGH